MENREIYKDIFYYLRMTDIYKIAFGRRTEADITLRQFLEGGIFRALYTPKPPEFWNKLDHHRADRGERPFHLAGLSLDEPLTVIYDPTGGCFEYHPLEDKNRLVKGSGITQTWVSHVLDRKYLFDGTFDELLKAIREQGIEVEM